LRWCHNFRIVGRSKLASNVTAFVILSRVNPSPILLGTSSFTASGWNGSFYPRGMKPSDYLSFYAERFHTVEVDSTFYACPSPRTVENWNARMDHRTALVLQVRSWMPDPSELHFDPITADWTYIRWLGDRKSIEEQTTSWDKTVVDRTEELTSWVDFCYQMRKRGVLVYAYANNHYSAMLPEPSSSFEAYGAAEDRRKSRNRSDHRGRLHSSSNKTP
jgi:uncharacterized protein YecE (DUF72 family)